MYIAANLVEGDILILSSSAYTTYNSLIQLLTLLSRQYTLNTNAACTYNDNLHLLNRNTGKGPFPEVSLPTPWDKVQ